MSDDTAAADTSCMHHWMIDQPNGPTSMGTCKICGLSQEFNNSVQGNGWDRDGSRRRAAARARRGSASA